MLRTYFVQQWFNLSDSGVEEALYEPAALRRFVGVDLGLLARRTRRRCCGSVICWSGTILEV
jgi:IS5 family transposase